MARRTKPTPYLVRVRRAENHHAAQLRKASNQIGELIKTWARSHEGDVMNPAHLPELERQLGAYQEAITPWADAQATRMAAEVAQKERRGWTQQAGQISSGIKRELASASVGPPLRALISEHASQIKSLPQEAAQRIFHLVGEGLSDPERHTEYIDQIMDAGTVSRSRATMLARTMVSSTTSFLVQTRAQNAGSVAYTWQTMEDGAVRPSHREMQGEICRWDSPPTVDGWTGPPGTAANCRCYPAPIWPDWD